jgi:hypothetical protein
MTVVPLNFEGIRKPEHRAPEKTEVNYGPRTQAAVAGESPVTARRCQCGWAGPAPGPARPPQPLSPATATARRCSVRYPGHGRPTLPLSPLQARGCRCAGGRAAGRVRRLARRAALPAAVACGGETLRLGGSLPGALPPPAADFTDSKTLRLGGSGSLDCAPPPPAAGTCGCEALRLGGAGSGPGSGPVPWAGPAPCPARSPPLSLPPVSARRCGR